MRIRMRINRPEQNRTEQNRIEQNRTEQNKTEQNRTEQNRTDQNRIENGCKWLKMAGKAGISWKGLKMDRNGLERLEKV